MLENQWDWAVNRDSAAPVKIKLQKADVSELYPGEAIVTFVLGGERYHGWMPDYAVDTSEKWLKAFIVGDYRNGDWRIFVPEETPKSTEFLRVPTSDQGKVVVEGWW